MRPFVLNSKEEQYLKEVQAEIAYCRNCQPHGKSEGDYIWIYGVRIELKDLMYKHSVPAITLKRKLAERVPGSCTFFD